MAEMGLYLRPFESTAVFYVAWDVGAWGILILNVVYTASWCRGFYNNWVRSPSNV